MPLIKGTMPKLTPDICKVKICPYYFYPKNKNPEVCNGCRHQRK